MMMMDFLKDGPSLGSLHGSGNDNHLLFGHQSALQSNGMCSPLNANSINHSMDNGLALHRSSISGSIGSSHINCAPSSSSSSSPAINGGGTGGGGGGGGANGVANSASNVATATPVISLFKLKNFLHQPRFKSLISNDGPNSVDESRSGSSGLDSSPSMHHGLYGNRSGANSSPNTGPGHQSLLVVPQPVKTSHMSNNPTANGTGRKYQCKMCPQSFGSKADMQLHTQIHMREAKPYKCQHCSKAFANSSYLSQHTRIHLGVKPYKCDMCQRKFTQLSHLQQHHRTHTGDKPYKCRHPGCSKAFSQLSNLQSHSRCHQTDKPFKCNSCYKCFADESSLLEHIPKHKESKHLKTHICQYCGKSYTQETYLAKHMQKHADRMDKHHARALALTGGNGLSGGGMNMSSLGGRSGNNNNNNSGGGGGGGPPNSNDTHPGLSPYGGHWATGNKGSSAAVAAALGNNLTSNGDDCGVGDLSSHHNQAHAHHPVAHHPHNQGPPHHHSDHHPHRANPYSSSDHPSPVSRYSSRNDVDPGSHRSTGSESNSTNTSGGGGGGSTNGTGGDNGNGADQLTNGRSSSGDMYRVDHKLNHNPVSSSSAFTPIQSASMLSSASMARNAVAAAYFQYDTFGFPKTSGANAGGPGSGSSVGNSTGGMEMKSAMDGKLPGGGGGGGHNSFPNQLIALHQIRNYASMPNSGSSSIAGEHPITLKDKPPQ
ncbi:uncharacterized protein LOC141857857 isoform X2 [Brevipalpus obovatus]|uniref:uncharacterized protein LOC141857857 isoform X2 n=1 Tax=Brevipalpus obovatus TaxID=246614 RepID=UPI003D9DB86C